MVEHLQSALDITSLAFTAAFGVWALFLGYRTFRYPACITYVHRAFVPFFGSVVRSLPELSVSVDGQPLSKNVVLVQGAFVCRGYKDITASMVAEPLTLQLKAGWHWLAVGKIEATSGLQPQITIQRSPPEGAVVSFGPLFRRDEYIAFTALVELDDPETEWSWGGAAVSCDHRIADTHVNRITAPGRRLTPTLRMIGGFAIYAVFTGLWLCLKVHAIWPLAVSVALWTMGFVTNIGAHFWRLRVARVLPRHLFPD